VHPFVVHPGERWEGWWGRRSVGLLRFLLDFFHIVVSGITLAFTVFNPLRVGNTVRGVIRPSLWTEKATFFDPAKRLVKIKARTNLPPLSGVSEIGEVEQFASGILQPGKTDVEERGNPIGTGTRILGHEVEIPPPPLRVDVHEVVHISLLRRWPEIPRLDTSVNEISRPCGDSLLQRFWHARWFGRSPCPLSWRHCTVSLLWTNDVYTGPYNTPNAVTLVV
jgi:hypothetical protein